MQNDNFKSVLNKVTDIGFKTGKFKSDDGSEIDYTSLFLKVMVDGNIQEIPLSGNSAIKPKLLALILSGITPRKEQTILDSTEE